MVRFSAAVAAALPASAAAETVLGSYIFSRHGDRTAKKMAPTVLTNLGYNQVYDSGEYFNSRYVSADSPQNIFGINPKLVSLSQLGVSAPVDNVLDSSAVGFLQGLYPPVGNDVSVQTLRNGTNYTAPLNGYQIIPVVTTTSGTRSEDNLWLQDATGCKNALTSSNQYFSSDEYNQLQQSTMDFYQSIYPVVNRTFNSSEMTFKNAYAIFDVINVALIHNASDTIQSFDLVNSQDAQRQLQALANAHEYGLAYNSSSEIRGIAGMTLAAEIVDYLNGTITSGGKQKLGIQFGAYGTFLSFFGLAQLAGKANGDDFFGIADYAATMTFELYTDADVTAFPTSNDDLRVRFLYNNGSSTAADAPTNYPLFGQPNLNLSWTDFVNGMDRFSVRSQQQFCQVCGNTTGACAPDQASTDSAATSTGGSGHGMSLAVAGVIGALVTLGVIGIIELAVILLGGLRLVPKSRLAQPAAPKA